jgi:hypothetical protein
MNPPAIRLPASAMEVAAESPDYGEFGRNLKDFLHQFMFTKERGIPLAPLLAQEPPRLASRFKEGKICDAFLAATADYLSRVNRIPTPEWALKDDLMLDEPWFSPDYIEVRLMLLRDTPSAFKDKNIFIFENALSVA